MVRSVKNFVEDRKITDPMVVSLLYGSNPPTKGPEHDRAFTKLKSSQKNLEFRMHPWMSQDLKDQISSSEQQQKGKKPDQPSKKKQGADIDEDEDVDPKSKKKDKKDIKQNPDASKDN